MSASWVPMTDTDEGIPEIPWKSIDDMVGWSSTRWIFLIVLLWSVPLVISLAILVVLRDPAEEWESMHQDAVIWTYLLIPGMAIVLFTYLKYGTGLAARIPVNRHTLLSHVCYLLDSWDLPYRTSRPLLMNGLTRSDYCIVHVPRMLSTIHVARSQDQTQDTMVRVVPYWKWNRGFVLKMTWEISRFASSFGATER